jgi:hypothetical protein
MDGFAARSRAALLWTAALLSLVLVGSVYVLDDPTAGWYDVEYAARIALLRDRRRESPDRPLLLVMGSSRTQLSFRAERLGELTAPDGRAVLPFNFSHTGAGPLMNLMQYYRLRREGMRPDWLILEVRPPALTDEHPQLLRDCMTASDYPVLSRYLEPTYLKYRYALSRLGVWFQHRNRILELTAPEWAEGGAASSSGFPLNPLGGDWLHTPEWLTPERSRRALDVARRQYSEELQHFTISRQADGATRELLALCRTDGVRTALLLTPEGSEFRSWYPADAERMIMEWCAAVSRDSGAPLIDARRWLSDECFFDSHHVLVQGAEAFTRRLEAEVLRPLVEGRLNRQED